MSASGRPVDPRRRRPTQASQMSASDSKQNSDLGIDYNRLQKILGYLSDTSKPRPDKSKSPECVIVTLGHATWNLMPAIYMFHNLVVMCKNMGCKVNVESIGREACRMIAEDRLELMHWLNRYSNLGKVRVVMLLGPEDIKSQEAVGKNLRRGCSMYKHIFGQRLAVEIISGLWSNSRHKYKISPLQKKYRKLFLLADENHFQLSQEIQSQVSVWPLKSTCVSELDKRLSSVWNGFVTPHLKEGHPEYAFQSKTSLDEMVDKVTKKMTRYQSPEKLKRQESFLDSSAVSEKLFDMLE